MPDHPGESQGKSFAPALRQLFSWLSHRSWASRWPQKVETRTSGKGGNRSLGSSGFVTAENFPLGKTSPAVCKAKLPQHTLPTPPPAPAVGTAAGECSHHG